MNKIWTLKDQREYYKQGTTIKELLCKQLFEDFQKYLIKCDLGLDWAWEIILADIREKGTLLCGLTQPELSVDYMIICKTQINIKIINDLTMLIATLIHEATHVYSYEKDYNQNVYHNKYFYKNKAILIRGLNLVECWVLVESEEDGDAEGNKNNLKDLIMGMVDYIYLQYVKSLHLKYKENKNIKEEKSENLTVVVEKNNIRHSFENLRRDIRADSRESKDCFDSDSLKNELEDTLSKLQRAHRMNCYEGRWGLTADCWDVALKRINVGSIEMEEEEEGEKEAKYFPLPLDCNPIPFRFKKIDLAAFLEEERRRKKEKENNINARSIH